MGTYSCETCNHFVETIGPDFDRLRVIDLAKAIWCSTCMAKEDTERYIRAIRTKAKSTGSICNENEPKDVERFTSAGDDIYIPVDVIMDYMAKWCHRDHEAKAALERFDFPAHGFKRRLYDIRVERIDPEIEKAQTKLNALKHKRADMDTWFNGGPTKKCKVDVDGKDACTE